MTSPAPAAYCRVQAWYRGRLGVEVGVFVAVDHLRRAGELTPNEVGAYLDELNAYGQADAPCPRCGTPISKIVVAGRGTHFCKRCQKQEVRIQ